MLKFEKYIKNFKSQVKMAPLWRHYGANHKFWGKNTGIFELPTSFPITFTINFFSHNVYFGLHLQKTDATDTWIRCALVIKKILHTVSGAKFIRNALASQESQFCSGS